MRLHQSDAEARLRRGRLFMGPAKRTRRRNGDEAFLGRERVAGQGMAFQESGLPRSRSHLGRLAENTRRKTVISRRPRPAYERVKDRSAAMVARYAFPSIDRRRAHHTSA